jgi:hypothetical protein
MGRKRKRDEDDGSSGESSTSSEYEYNGSSDDDSEDEDDDDERNLQATLAASRAAMKKGKGKKRGSVPSKKKKRKRGHSGESSTSSDDKNSFSSDDDNDSDGGGTAAGSSAAHAADDDRDYDDEEENDEEKEKAFSSDGSSSDNDDDDDDDDDEIDAQSGASSNVAPRRESRKQKHKRVMEAAHEARKDARERGDETQIAAQEIGTYAKRVDISQSLRCPKPEDLARLVRRVAIASPNTLWKIGQCFAHCIPVRPFSTQQYPSDIYEHAGIMIIAHDLTGHDYPVLLERTASQLAKALGCGVNTKHDDNIGHSGYHDGDKGVIYMVPCRDDITTQEEFDDLYVSYHYSKKNNPNKKNKYDVSTRPKHRGTYKKYNVSTRPKSRGTYTKKKTCKCGSLGHKRISSADCPLNPKK